MYRYLFSGDGFRREDLPDDFPGREVAFEAQQAGGAEFAAEGAAHLGGNAEGDAVRLFPVFRSGGGNDDGFHQIPRSTISSMIGSMKESA